MTIRLLRRDEPPVWRPEKGAAPDEDRELARKILTRLREDIQHAGRECGTRTSH